MPPSHRRGTCLSLLLVIVHDIFRRGGGIRTLEGLLPWRGALSLVLLMMVVVMVMA